jgi:hypothetical protein
LVGEDVVQGVGAIKVDATVDRQRYRFASVRMLLQ